MRRNSRSAAYCAGIALSALLVGVSSNTPARAQNAPAVTDATLKALQAQIDALQKQVKQLESQQQQSTANADAAKANADAAKKQAAQAQAQAQQAKASVAETKTQVANLPAAATAKDDWFFRHKPGSALTFETPGGEITGYGNFDVSFDGAAKSVTGTFTSLANTNGGGGIVLPNGNFGWMPDISTNNSYLGFRGYQRIPGWDGVHFVYQMEAGIDISAAPGDKQSNSNVSNQVNGALFSRNSFIGLSSPAVGAIKIGKSDAPYKNSTAAFNPFAGEWGDYAVVMGNTGGDNRVEFGTRVSHAVWYESPTMGGFQWNLMYAPGQNRSWISDQLPAGESDCAGGNDPTSGADLPTACNDGSFSDLISGNISYTYGGFYATAAYEWHHAVNRQSDITGMYGIGTCLGSANAFASAICNQDVADEDAAKIGALYKFKSSGTTIGAIVEHMTRYVPQDLEFQNERTRWGTWVFLTQQVNPTDTASIGWAHAFHTPGDPCQHNDCTLTTPDGAASYATNQNQADMITANYKHNITKDLIWYSDIAATFNGPSAHFDLGAGGRSVTTDCHDISTNDASGGALANPHCFTGTTVVGVSTGLQYKF